MGKVDENVLSWLTTVPAGDINFRSKLAGANIETLKEALKKKGLSKLAVKSILNKITKIEKLLNIQK